MEKVLIASKKRCYTIKQALKERMVKTFHGSINYIELIYTYLKKTLFAWPFILTSCNI